ncbi:glutamine--tRNA ligase [Ereboglobus luteus]|uniref:Glutamine--tRNA ligase n=1 Tax=Ereboglobus luteus TaxID=1796921 RepID=A0A2U8E0X7_9BACT|nr:glutamine--tRNA ligase [Ereboglobus luteus]AWI08425.1 glutamine--tRNA ligase [Ereboglobus luteus]
MSAENTAENASTAPTDFIRDIVAADVAQKRYPKIITRFPPEPNGYLHLGHAKSICLNFGIALENGGVCNLRMDDTNPAKEEVEYVEAITDDINWLISGWADKRIGLTTPHAHPAPATIDGKLDYHLPAANISGNAESQPGAFSPFFASDYFDALYAYAEQLILKGKAYVCDLSPEQTDEYRGAPDKPGKPSPWRDRTIEESLDLFRRMKAGEFPDGARTLRARIDMASPNVWLRDPLLYRIRHTAHHHAGDKWCVYPLYDYAHCISDYIEGITHSICTLEFVAHRPLYDWILEALDLPRPLPHQYEFAKLNLAYTLFSKRRLMRLVKENVVNGWDDPRMPTIAGIRRRGIPSAAIRNFAYNIGVTKYDSLTELAVYENAIRDELNATAHRRMAVLKPIKIVLTNIAPGETIECRATNHPGNPDLGTRPVELTREVFIEADDFAEVPPPKYFRLKPGGEVRLKYACIIKLDEIIKDADGRLVELRCTADLTTRAGQPNVNRKVKGTIHWVSAASAIDAEVRLYDRLFTVPEPGADDNYLDHLNPSSVETVTAKLEPSLADAAPDARYQFERLGYFTIDGKDSKPGALVFNRTITLKSK